MSKKSIVITAYFFNGILSVTLGVFTSFFFLGAQEQYLELLKNVLQEFFMRWLITTIPALILLCIILIVFLLLNHFKKPEQMKIDMPKQLLYHVLIAFIPTLIGTIIFFYQ